MALNPLLVWLLSYRIQGLVQGQGFLERQVKLATSPDSLWVFLLTAKLVNLSFEQL